VKERSTARKAATSRINNRVSNGVTGYDQLRNKWLLAFAVLLRDSIMTTIIHSVSRVTSTGSSEELAESHVNKLLGWQLRTPIYR
jgi:hypothetical protein